MLTLQTLQTDPAYNLALEQALFESLPPEEEALWLWQNEPSVIVGRHQNTADEVDLDAAETHHVHVVRRASGGGAVYHDLGNVNFTYITRLPEDGRYDLAALTRPVLRALASLGVEGRVSGRNDLCIDGRKFSGNAQFIHKGRVLHHGTLLFDTDLSRLGQFLTPPTEKLRGHGVPSVKARVTNIRPHLKAPLSVGSFISALQDSFRRMEHPKDYVPDTAMRARVAQLQVERYRNADWNIGASPRYTQKRIHRFPGGTLCAYLDTSQGILRQLRLTGDFFGAESTAPLEAALSDTPLRRESLSRRLEGLPVSRWITGLDADALVTLLLAED